MSELIVCGTNPAVKKLADCSREELLMLARAGSAEAIGLLLMEQSKKS